MVVDFRAMSNVNFAIGDFCPESLKPDTCDDCRLANSIYRLGGRIDSSKPSPNRPSDSAGLHQPRLGELNFISGIVIHAEIAVSPRFERDPLGQMSTACLKLGVQRIEVLRKDVNPYA
jgi:hypothetical protein